RNKSTCSNMLMYIDIRYSLQFEWTIDNEHVEFRMPKCGQMPKYRHTAEYVVVYCLRLLITPSFRIFDCRVVRFMPSLAAAPCGPAKTQLVASRALRMWSRSAARRVRVSPTCSEGGLSSLSGTRRTGPGETITARSIKFSSSRIFPGQG